MKLQLIYGSALFMFLTAVNPVWAQESEATTTRTSIEEESTAADFNELAPRINPQLGVSSFEYSGTTGNSKQKLSGGATIELGAGIRKIETGLLLLQSGSEAQIKGVQTEINSTNLVIPMMAKIRLTSLAAQSWYAKFGFMSSFEIDSTQNDATNNIDVLASLGISGRFNFNRKSDFIIETSYNRGMIDTLRAAGTHRNQGFLVLAGLSFRI